MVRPYGECSLMKEITKTEDAIKNCYDRVAALERKLLAKDFPEDKEENVRQELVECRKLLKTNKELLSTLHKDNRGTFMFGVAATLICFLIWMLYILVKGDEF